MIDVLARMYVMQLLFCWLQEVLELKLKMMCFYILHGQEVMNIPGYLYSSDAEFLGSYKEFFVTDITTSDVLVYVVSFILIAASTLR